MEEGLKKSGAFRWSGTLNGLAIESARRIVWVCPPAPVLLAYSLDTGSKLAEYSCGWTILLVAGWRFSTSPYGGRWPTELSRNEDSCGLTYRHPSSSRP